MGAVYIEDNSQVTRVPNQLSNLKFNRLDTVYMRRNQIRFIQSGAFNFVKKMQSLFMDSNPVEAIEPDAFQGTCFYRILLIIMK